MLADNVEAALTISLLQSIANGLEHKSVDMEVRAMPSIPTEQDVLSLLSPLRNGRKSKEDWRIFAT